MHPTQRLLVFLLFYVFTLPALAQQVCTGALGDPVVNINFGSGTSNFGPPLGSAITNYNYVSGTPNDGDYTIAKSTIGMHADPTGWHQISNHTPGDPNGYMMVINASNTPGIFYQTTIPNLCPGTTYEFAAWIINILNYSGIKPNITFTIETSAGSVLKSYNTGDIPDGSTPIWKQYATTFTTTSQTDLVLKITNNGMGGNGNDIALDDITFRACGPVITPSINNNTTALNICEGSSNTYNLSAQVSSGYLNPVFQWQVNTGTGWTDLAGKTSPQTTVTFNNASPGTYQYRLVAAENGNISSVNCRVASSGVSIVVNPFPTVIADNGGPVCIGDALQLKGTGTGTYSWTGPNGYTSTLKDPVINNVTKQQAGLYTLSLTSNGCTISASTLVEVLDPLVVSSNVATATICASGSFKLEAYGGTSYKWSPAEGLSDPDISNPVASPKESTTYTVSISNGGCATTLSIDVKVIKNATADAGTDLKILSGQSINLNGRVSGDEVTYFWSPSDYLDDPTKLNPKANPPKDMVYTLYAQSNAGCFSASDDVFIKVYPKIVIPNSFSPNGDGVNDTWSIPAAEAFPNARVKVLNRNGGMVFQRNGLYIPWDGKSNGQDLPVGTYYYTIYFNEDFETFSGWVFLLR